MSDLTDPTSEAYKRFLAWIDGAVSLPADPPSDLVLERVENAVLQREVARLRAALTAKERQLKNAAEWAAELFDRLKALGDVACPECDGDGFYLGSAVGHVGEESFTCDACNGSGAADPETP